MTKSVAGWGEGAEESRMANSAPSISRIMVRKLTVSADDDEEEDSDSDDEEDRAAGAELRLRAGEGRSEPLSKAKRACRAVAPAWICSTSSCDIG